MSNTQSLRKGDLVSLDLQQCLRLTGFPVLEYARVEAHKAQVRQTMHRLPHRYKISVAAEFMNAHPVLWGALLALIVGLWLTVQNTDMYPTTLLLACAAWVVSLAGLILASSATDYVWRRIPLEKFLAAESMHGLFRLAPHAPPMPKHLVDRARQIEAKIPGAKVYIDAFGTDPIIAVVERHSFFKQAVCYVGGWDTGDETIDNA